MKRLCALILFLCMAASFSGCDIQETSGVDTAAVSETGVGSAVVIETETSETSAATTEAGAHFEFKPLVMSSIFRDIMGEDMCLAYSNYIDAVRAGEDSFEVKSEHDYDWMIGHFPAQFQPLYFISTESGYGGAYKDGRATFQYKIPKDELKVKEAEFKKKVTGILNENLRDDYSDLEKVLALYLYISKNCSYDYDALELDPLEMDKQLSSYRFLFENKGICFECAGAYNYLLLQAGVECASIGGLCHNDNEGHAWSYVTINGKNYHVDPTYAMGDPSNLSYFMMTDSQREMEGNFVKSEMSIGCHYKEDHNGDKYDADDDSFAPLWGGTFSSFDHEKKLIHYYDKEGKEAVFDYSAWG